MSSSESSATAGLGAFLAGARDLRAAAAAFGLRPLRAGLTFSSSSSSSDAGVAASDSSLSDIGLALEDFRAAGLAGARPRRAGFGFSSSSSSSSAADSSTGAIFDLEEPAALDRLPDDTFTACLLELRRLFGFASTSTSIFTPLPLVLFLPFAGCTSSSSSSSWASASTDGRDFLMGGSSSCSSSPDSCTSGKTFDREATRPFGGGATLGLAEELLLVVLDAGFATFSFSSGSGSAVWPRLRLPGNISATGGSTWVLGARDERRGGMALEAVESCERPRIEHYDVTDASVTTKLSRGQQKDVLNAKNAFTVKSSKSRDGYIMFKQQKWLH
jgi:hypothetical protein